MSKLDVVVVGPFPEDLALIKGGVQASVLGLAVALAKRDDAAVQVFALPVNKHAKRERAVIGNIDVTYLDMPLHYQAALIFHLPKILSRIKASSSVILHVHGTGFLQTALCIAARLQKIPIIWTLHGITEKETRQRLRDGRHIGDFGRYIFYTALERCALRVVSTIIVDTQYVKDEINARAAAVHVIPQGINMQELAPYKCEPDLRTPCILSVGAMTPRKGHHLTLQAFAKIKTLVPLARLVIMGTLTIPDYYQALIRQTAALGLTGCVEIIANASRTEILTQLARASVFALHSQEESQGIALCEALAVGLPIVATRIGGIPYVVDDGQNGLLVSYEDVDGFSYAVLRLLTDQNLLAQFSANARRSSVRFDWDIITASVMALYREQV